MGSVKETGEQGGGGLRCELQEVQGNMEPGVSSDREGNTGVLKVKKKGRPRKDEGCANNVDSGKSGGETGSTLGVRGKIGTVKKMSTGSVSDSRDRKTRSDLKKKNPAASKEY